MWDTLFRDHRLLPRREAAEVRREARRREESLRQREMNEQRVLNAAIGSIEAQEWHRIEAILNAAEALRRAGQTPEPPSAQRRRESRESRWTNWRVELHQAGLSSLVVGYWVRIGRPPISDRDAVGLIIGVPAAGVVSVEVFGAVGRTEAGVHRYPKP